MGKRNGLSRGDARRNARLIRLRGVVRHDRAILAIDLADTTQALAVCDHDSRVLARRSVRGHAWQPAGCVRAVSPSPVAGIPIALDLLMIVYVLVSVDSDIDVCQYEGVDRLACCQPLADAPLSAAGARQLAGVLKALADPARLRLLSLIQARQGAEACVCHLTEPLGLTQPTVSHHLKVLHEAGLLARERRGVWVYYRVVPDALQTLADLLTVPSPATAA